MDGGEVLGAVRSRSLRRSEASFKVRNIIWTDPSKHSEGIEGEKKE